MNTVKLVTPDMPDIANRTLQSAQAKLDWVGMSNVHQPLRVKDGDQSKEVQANIQVYVNLADPHAKGIHMSRLYLILDEHAATRPLTAAGLKMLLSSVLESHHDLSTNAFVQFEFDHFVRRAAVLDFSRLAGAESVLHRDRKGPKCWAVLACGTRLCEARRVTQRDALD